MGSSAVNDANGKPVSIERVDEFYGFLQGAAVPGMHFGRSRPRLSAGAANAVIYFLQEHMDLIPDVIEQCVRCHNLFDTDYDGATIRDRQYCSLCAAEIR